MKRIPEANLIFLCIVLTYTAYGQNTLRTSFGLRGKVVSFSTRAHYETGLDKPRRFSNATIIYSFDQKGRLRTVIDSIFNTKTTYDYNDKGFAIKTTAYKSDTLYETTILTRQKDKIMFQSGQSRGYYIVDKRDRITERASYAAAKDSVIYKETFTYDENSIVKSWYITYGNSTMKMHFTNEMIKKDKRGNWILYNSISDNVMNKKGSCKREIQYR